MEIRRQRDGGTENLRDEQTEGETDRGNREKPIQIDTKRNREIWNDRLTLRYRHIHRYLQRN